MLQPLSELPFDLHLLSESRLQRKQEQNQPSIQRSSFFVLSGCDRQQVGSKLKKKREPCAPSQKEIRTSCSTNIHKIPHGYGVTVSEQSTREEEQKPLVCSEKKRAGWWLSHTPINERVMEAECSVPHIQNDVRLLENRDRRKERFSTRTDEVKPAKELRWARLFGSDMGSPMAVEKDQRGIKQNQSLRSVPLACEL